MSRKETVEALRLRTQAIMDGSGSGLRPAAKDSSKARRCKTASRRASEDQEYEAPEKTAFARVLELVSFQERCTQKLVEKLCDEGYARTEALEAVERAKSYGYVDDSRFAQLLARKRAMAGKGQLYVSRELKSLGIDPGSVPGWPYDFFGDENDQIAKALDLLEKHPPRSKDLYSGACRKLAGRGFSSSVSARAAKQWLNGYRQNSGLF